MKMSNKYLDEIQSNVHKNFDSSSWLSDPKHIEKFMMWNTFFRENINRYAEIYYGFNLHPYQHLELLQMSKNDISVIVGSRATAKSYVVAIFACCIASLYPRSRVVIASGTKGQAQLIVTEKIRTELMPKSANLRREIKKIKEDQKDIIVFFKNGSTIKVVPASDNARGNRSTVVIYEEFRMIDKFIIDSVLSPFQVVRDRPFTSNPAYTHMIEEPKDIYISSSWYSSHWMQGLIDTVWEDMKSGKDSCILGFDYSLTLLHKIKTRNQIYKDYVKFDPITFAIEYENRMIAQNSRAFFTFDLIHKNQKLNRPAYPRRSIDIISKAKNRHVPSKQEGEIRVIACDIAPVGGDANDNSVYSFLRLIPENVNIGGNKGHKEFKIQVPYLEAMCGGETVKQAVRIKQLFYDFDADYCVLDTRNAGISVGDALMKVLYDEDRDCEYKPWTYMNNDEYAKRVSNPNAEPVIFSISAGAKLNSDVAQNMRRMLAEERVEFLIGHADGIAEITKFVPEYHSLTPEEQVLWEKPFLETACLVNEMVELEYEKGEQTGLIKIKEVGLARKDRYTSVSYGCYFCDLVYRDMYNRTESSWDNIPKCVSVIEF